MDSVLKKVMKRIKPSRREERKVEREVKGFVEELEKRCWSVVPMRRGLGYPTRTWTSS